MESYLIFQAVVLYQSDVHGWGPVLAPFQQQSHSLTGRGLETMGFHCCVQGLLGHGAVCGPLPPSDGDQAAVAHVDDVVPADGLRVFGVGVRDQGSYPTPRCQNIPSPHW